MRYVMSRHLLRSACVCAFQGGMRRRQHAQLAVCVNSWHVVRTPWEYSPCGEECAVDERVLLS
jgi:hypothetical protein